MTAVAVGKQIGLTAERYNNEASIFQLSERIQKRADLVAKAEASGLPVNKMAVNEAEKRDATNLELAKAKQAALDKWQESNAKQVKSWADSFGLMGKA